MANRICGHCKQEFFTKHASSWFCSIKCRFMVKTKISTNGCIEWQAAEYKNGYGKFGHIRASCDYAHRVSWRIFRGEIPKGMMVLHKCDNRKCINHEHLFLGNQADNIHDMHNKNRQRKSKITGSDLSKMQAMSHRGITQLAISKEFSISQALVSLLLLGKVTVSITSDSSESRL